MVDTVGYVSLFFFNRCFWKTTKSFIVKIVVTIIVANPILHQLYQTVQVDHKHLNLTI
jgi:hypothetical protein